MGLRWRALADPWASRRLLLATRPGSHDAALDQLVELLVGREVPVYGAVPAPPTLEDVYFEVQRRIAEDPTWSIGAPA